MIQRFFISELLPSERAFVASLEVQTPIRLGTFTVGDKIPAGFYITDGGIDYSDISGAANYQLNVSIGIPGQVGNPAYTAAFTRVTNGWEGVLDLGFTSGGKLQRSSTEPFEAVLEAKVVDPLGNIKTYARQVIIILPGVLNGTPGSDPVPPTPTQTYLGTYELPMGAAGGTISGLALPRTPTGIKSFAVSTPADGLNLFANLVQDTLDEDGFEFVLNGQTNVAGFVLTYEITF